MDAERWQRVAFLKEACQGDEGLRADVAALLRGHRETGAFGETPVALSSAMASCEETKARLKIHEC